MFMLRQEYLNNTTYIQKLLLLFGEKVESHYLRLAVALATWYNYAVNGNGICIEFDVGNYEYLYPIEYVEKLNVDFDQMVISAINESDMALSIIPWVIKNPYNQCANIDSTKEKEVRILYCPYDNGEVNCGIIQKDIKEQLRYRGIEKPYSDFKLEISKVIIGENCNKEIADDLKRYFAKNGILYVER